MARKDPTALRDEAAKAIERGKFDRAIEIYVELEALEPANPQWPKRLGETYRRKNENRNAVAAFERAAVKYVDGGFLVQAIAVCKLILQIDASHSATIAMLVELAPGQRPTEATPALAPRGTSMRAPTAGGDEPPRAPVVRAATTPGVDAPSARPPVRAATSGGDEGAVQRAPVVRVATSPGTSAPSPSTPPPPPPRLGPPPLPSRSGPPSAPQSSTSVPPPRAPANISASPPTSAAPPRAPARMSVSPPASATAAMRSAAAASMTPRATPGAPPRIPGAPPRIPAPPLRPAAPPLTAIPVSVPAGRALDALDLATVIPGSKRLSTKGGQWSGINVVTIDEPLVLLEPADEAQPVSHVITGEIPVEIDAASLLSRSAPSHAAANEQPLDDAAHGELSLDDGEAHGELSLDDATSNDGNGTSDDDIDPPTAARIDQGTSSRLDAPTSHRVRAATAAPMRVLTGTPLFSELSPKVLELLIPRMKLVVLDPDEVLFNEGDAGDCLYVVSEGEVAVETGGNELARLGPGSFFGEVALVTDQPRSATVRAVTRVEALAIDRDVVRDAAAEQPDIVNTLLRFVRERLVDRMARTSSLFQSFTEGERASLITRFEFLEIAADVHLIVEGQRTDGLYVVVAGVVEVWRDASTAPLAVLGSGDVFGEMALLGDGAATASCTTATRVIALRMPAATFREVIMTHPQVLAYLSDIEAARSPRSDGDDVLGVHLELL